jgi:hypothetical protein
MSSEVVGTSSVLEETDLSDVNELYQANGWTDGLPIVEPTEARVRASLELVGMPPSGVLGVEPVRERALTVEKVAINAVMAGCLPEHVPVVVAAIEAMCDERFLLHGCTASTGGAGPMLVVNGPIRLEIGMNTTHNALANASRANASIGRAVRLVLINLLDCVPGRLDRATLGHPGKFTFCVAEDEEDSPWLSVAEERGAPVGVSAVTVMSAISPHQVMNEWTDNPAEILETFAAAIRASMLTYSIWSGNYAIVIAKQLRDIIAAAGWTKADIREFIYERARVHRRDWAGVGKANIVEESDPQESKEYAALGSPDDLLVIAAGGPAGGFGAIIPPWMGHKSQAVTRIIGGSVDVSERVS